MQKLKLKGRVLPTSLPAAAAADVEPAAETGTCSLIAVAIGTASSRPRPRPPTEDCGGRMSTAAAAAEAGSREEMSQLLRTWGLAR